MTPLTLAALLLSSAAGPPPVAALAYRADGGQLAVGTRDTVLLVDPAKGDLTHELPGQTGRVTGLAYSPAGHLAVASGEPGKSGLVRLYRPGGTKPVAEFPAHKDAVYAVAFSPDGKTLATAGYDRLVKLWDVPPKAAPRLTLADHSDSVYAAAFSPDGKLLASAAADRAVKVWDVATGKRLYTLGDPTDWVYAVAWSPDGRQLAAGGVDKSIRVWDVSADGGKLIRSAFAHDKAVSRLLYAADGKTLYSVGEDKAVKAWNPATLSETTDFPDQPETVLAAALRPDGKQLAVGRFDGMVQLLDPATGKATMTPVPAKPKPPAVVKITPDAGPRGKTVRVTVEGTNLDATAAKVAGARARLLPGGVVEVVVPADAPVGATDLRLVGPGGESNPVRFWIDRFPAAAERGTTDAARTGMTVAPPVTVAGRLDRAGDADFYRFKAAAGQEVGVQLGTAPDAAGFAPVLTLSDETGQVVAEGDGGRLGYVCPAAGVYSVGVRDAEYRGGAGMAYRLHLGPVPVVTGVFPLGVQRGVETPVRVVGVNLGSAGGLVVPVKPPADAAVGTKIPVPLKRVGGDPVGTAAVAAGEFPAVAVSGGTAILGAVPGTADGELSRPGEAHAVRFRATKGQRLIVETAADRLGSPVDSFVEILDADGKPVPKAVLRCLAKTSMNLRDRSSSDPGLRLEAWNELAMRDYLYADGELMRIDELPRGPDDDCKFVAVEGRRVGFLGTTPKYHAYGATLYKVAVHPPGSTFPPNGMPVFPLFERNDDGGPGYGKDSRVEFDPPADGEYVARVADAAGAGGPGYAYRLTVRRPRPDYALKFTPTGPTVPRGGAASVGITATRMDGFDGPIEVRFDGLAAPFHAPATVIDAEQTATAVALSAGAGPAGKPAPLRLVGRAVIDGKEVVREAKGMAPKLAEKAGELVTRPAVGELTIRPGEEARLTVRVERNGFTGRIPLDVRGLPYGVRVMNVGLSGILILPGQTEREVFIYAEPWVEPTDRPFAVVATKDRAGSEATAPAVTLKVRR
jgi:hypothetical protein